MLRSIEELDTYRYHCDDVSISVQNSDEPILIEKTFVHGISMVKDFDNKIIPYISLKIQVERDMYRRIQSSLDIMRINLDISKYKELDSEIKYRETVLKGSFKLINQDLLDPSVVDSQSSDIGDTGNDYIDIDLYLYDDSYIKKYRKMLSNSIRGTLTDLIYHTFQPRGFNNVLMSHIRNDRIGNFVLEYGDLGSNLKFINHIYGIYNSPYMFFMDNDVTYMIDQSQLGKTLRPLEYGLVNMYLEEFSSVESLESGCYVDKNNGNYIINMDSIPKIMDIDTNVEYLKYSKLNYIVSGTTHAETLKFGELDIEKACVVNNTKLISQDMFTANESKRSMTISLSNIDIDIITPNKLYCLIPHKSYDVLYNMRGNYRLSKCVISLVRDGDVDLTSKVVATLNKQ